jgi:GNAT superfamily N-acetyltransferase
MKNLLIRRAKCSDVEKLVWLRLLLEQHCEESNPSIWHITEEGKTLLKQKEENILRDSSNHVLVAEVNGKIIGSTHGEVVHRTDYLPKCVGAIHTLYVVEKFRRKGVGACLVKELCKFFKSEGVEQVTLRYILGNKEAEAFWKKRGFEPIITTAITHLEELASRAAS